MANFTVNTHRVDPYKNFKFRIKSEGRYVAGFSKASALNPRAQIVHSREGGDPSSAGKSPGRTDYDAITLERGVTHDPEFEGWANGIGNAGGRGAQVSSKDLHKDLILEVLNETGAVVLAYKIRNCWVSKIAALPDPDADATAVAIEHITLENEGWKPEGQ